jgi:hypothetical protein
LPFAPLQAAPSFDLGISASQLKSRIGGSSGTVESTTSDTGLHFAIGVSRRTGERGEIGVRAEFDEVGSDLMLAVRAIDYRRHISERFAYGVFAGAARLDRATPAYGYYYGAGFKVKGIMSGWDLGIDLRLGDEIARDNLLPTDPQGGSPDNFFNVTALSIYLSRQF